MWVVLGLLTAVLHSGEGAWCKHLGLRGFSPLILSLSLYLFAIPLYLISLISSGIPAIGPAFWFSLMATSILNLTSIVLYMDALRHGELGTVFPLLALSPAFMLLTSWAILGESPGPGGYLGIAFMCAGIYLLGLQPGASWHTPLKLTKKSSMEALCCSFLWSIASNFEKLGTQNSSPAFYLACRDSLVACGYLIIVALRAPAGLKSLWKFSHAWRLSLVGLLSASALLLQLEAQLLTHAAYPMAIKRLSIIGAGILGRIYFNEPLRLKKIGAWLCLLAGLAALVVKS